MNTIREELELIRTEIGRERTDRIAQIEELQRSIRDTENRSKPRRKD